MHSKNPIILVDGSSYLFRAYHALPPLTTSHNEPTGAIYGVTNMIRKLMNEYKDSDHFAVVFDSKGKTFRHDMYADYKANRPEMPEELRVQIQPIHDIIQAMGIPIIKEVGYEADDIIGTLAKQAEKKGLNVLISTGDKDFAQLVSAQVTLINTMNNTVTDMNGVVEKFGIPAECIIDYLALMGDSVDNIPGVPNVGPKTAVKWLQEYGSLDGVIEHASHIKGKVGENLRNNLAQLSMSKTLATIRLDAPIRETLSDLKLRPANIEQLTQYFKRFEFNSWLKEISQETPSNVQKQYQTIFQQSDLDSWIQKLKTASCYAFDTETTSLDAMNAELVGLSFCVSDHVAAYVPLAHNYLGVPEQLNRADVLQQLAPIFSDKAKTMIGQNLKYDLKVLANYGAQVDNAIYDTLIASYVLNSTSQRHDLDTLAEQYLDHHNIKFEDIAGKGAKQLTFNQIAIETASTYAAEDADIVWQLCRVLQKELKQYPKLASLLDTIELPLVKVLTDMEFRGVLVDANRLHQQSQILEKCLQKLTDEIFTLAGEAFNIDSPSQLQQILFEKLGLPVKNKTPKGQPSTAENVLQELAREYELPAKILHYRSLRKLKSTYTDKLPLQINKNTGRIHTSYNQAVVATGRLSSRDPNLQNIPVRNEEGRKIRQAFIAPPGKKIISADYSQVELRIMAHLSKDKGLIEAFHKGLDIHKATAAEVFSVPLEAVTSDQRRHAKAINFGLIYGMSAFGLAQQLGIDRQHAQDYIDIYFHRYPGIHQYMEKTREDARKQGYVETLFGRRLVISEINSSNGMRRAAAERAAINAPMQGTAADIIKRAMICLYEFEKHTSLDIHMIMQVHDELIFEVIEKEVEAATKAIRDCMMNAADLVVPLIVDVGVGDNWDEAH